MKYLATVMMKFKVLLLVLFAFAKANFIQAQSSGLKLEKEERVKKGEFPADALPYVQQLANGNRIKYFREFDGERTSYEAKFKSKGRKYSVEYSEAGILEDVEIEVSKGKLPTAEWQNIQRQLGTYSDRWKVEKIQLQYLSLDDGLELLREQIAKKNYQHIEMIVAFKDKRKIYRKELLINRAGEIIKEREVKRRAYDFLLF